MTFAKYCSKECHYSSGIIRRYSTEPSFFKRWRETLKCESCDSPFISSHTKHVDHCHDSLKVRGILCGNCNQALGNVKDDVKKLKNLIKYIEGWEKKDVLKMPVEVG